MSDDGAAGQGGQPLGISPTIMLIIEGRVAERRVESELAPLDLSLRKFGILGHLRREPGLSFTEVARRSRITVQSVHVLLQSLSAAGLVHSSGPGGRGRAAVVSLTEEGQKRMSAAAEIIARLDAEIFEAGERAVLGRSLSRLASAVLPGAAVPTVEAPTDDHDRA